MDNANQATTIPNTAAATTITVTITTNPTVSSSSQQGVNNTPNNVDSDDVCTGPSVAVVGASISVPLGCAFLVAFFLFVWERRKNNRMHSRLGGSDDPVCQTPSPNGAPSEILQSEIRQLAAPPSAITDIQDWNSRVKSIGVLSEDSGPRSASIPTHPVELHASGRRLS